tara:strand:+ start:163 stop:648 length:486 start_codon:yes stop_codon:yes gene_type:complete
MLSIKFNKIIINTLIVLIIFGLDRISKIYILSLAETNNLVDIYISPFLNLYLVWNKGIAFGLFSFDQKLIYNLITILIVFIIIIIFIMIIKSTHNRFFLLLILGGSLGNIFDRLYYSAVPDFIDFHINNFHWFIFNVADIFITIGVICLIFVEIFVNKVKD